MNQLFAGQMHHRHLGLCRLLRGGEQILQELTGKGRVDMALHLLPQPLDVVLFETVQTVGDLPLQVRIGMPGPLLYARFKPGMHEHAENTGTLPALRRIILYLPFSYNRYTGYTLFFCLARAQNADAGLRDARKIRQDGFALSKVLFWGSCNLRRQRGDLKRLPVAECAVWLSATEQAGENQVIIRFRPRAGTGSRDQNVVLRPRQDNVEQAYALALFFLL